MNLRRDFKRCSAVNRCSSSFARVVGFLLGFLALSALVKTADAQTAQPWISDRRFFGGAGARRGNVEFHPSVATELGYDSNFFQGAGLDPQWRVFEPIVPTLRFRLTPSLTVSSLGAQRKAGDGSQAAPPKVNFLATIAGRFNKLYSLDSQYTDKVNSKNLIGGNAGLVLDILPRRPWGADLGFQLSRIVQPNNNPSLAYTAFNRTIVGGKFALKWRPGGGVLQWSLGYRAKAMLFDQSEFGLDRLNHGLYTQGRWRFLPRTSLLYEGEVGAITYLQQETRQRSSHPMSSQLGINGLITTRLGLLLMGGWKTMLYEPDQSGNVEDFDSAIGRAELTWYLSAAPEKAEDGRNVVGFSSVAFGVQRDALNSGIANYYEINRAYVDVAYFAGGVFMLNLNGGAALVKHPVPRDEFGRALTVDGKGLFEIRPNARLYAQYRLSQTWAALANLGFSASTRNNRILIVRSPVTRDNLKYYRFTSFLGVRWFM